MARIAARGWVPGLLALMFLLVRLYYVGNLSPTDSSGSAVTTMTVISLFISSQILTLEGEFGVVVL